MKSVIQIVHDAVSGEFPDIQTIHLTRPEAKFGDFTTNVALQLAGSLGKNPREVAGNIAEKLRDTNTFAEVNIAGPGFINMRLQNEVLLKTITLSSVKGREGETVVIETNNPNPFKAMHIGHAFNAILADTIANLIEDAGAHTYRVSYHGDVGLHVGKSMYALLKYVDGEVSKLNAIPTSEHNSFMSRMYAEGARAYNDDESAKKEIEELAKQSFTREDPLYASVYDTCKQWSFDQIDEIVSSLGNKPIERRFLESDADTRGVPIVKKNVPRVFEESDGALIFRGSKYGSFDNAYVASNGLGLYGARDLGLMQLKNEYYHPDKSYIVTAEEQRDYFKGVIAAAGLCMPDLKNVTVNISTGTVKLTTGKMSSRDGDVIEISWLFEKVREAIKARGGEPTNEIVAGALRYQFLKVKIGSDVIFDINEAVSLQGNTGSYLQYAYARANTILQKSSLTPSEVENIQMNDSERLLVRKLSEYNDIVNLSLKELLPHHLCTYLYELAQEFNRFYEKNKVIGSETEADRLALVGCYAQTLRQGLSLLGIKAPEKM